MNLEKLQRFVREEDGQTTTEYVLILAVILTIIMQFKKRLLAGITGLFIKLDKGFDEVDKDW